VLKPIRPFDDPVVLLLPLLIPVVPVPAELPMLLEAAGALAVSPLVPPAPAPCARAMDELIARIEAKAIVESFMCCSLLVADEEAAPKATAQQAGRAELGRPWGRAVGGTGTGLMWVRDPPPPLNFP
jgi:hypothetical protein